MAGGFSDKEREEIRQKLLDSGYELSTDIGLKKMTVAMIAGSAGMTGAAWLGRVCDCDHKGYRNEIRE